MSKAFTDEEAADAPRVVAPRAPLPAGTPNYVTARGLRLLNEELAALERERATVERGPEGASRALALAALAQQRSQLEARIGSAELAPLPPEPRDRVRFGAHVRVEGESGERRYQIVGIDEADAAQGRIAFVSPLARALLGLAVGDTARLRAPHGEEQLEIVAVSYDDEGEGD